MAAPIALLSAGGGSGPSSVPDGIPGAFVPIYRESARAFHLDWLLLASVHQQETGFSTNPTTYHGLNAAGCCAGPFQFNLTNGPPSTWESHRLAYRRGARPARLPAPAGCRTRRSMTTSTPPWPPERCCATTAPTRPSAPAPSKPSAPTTAPDPSPRPTPDASSTAPASGRQTHRPRPATPAAPAIAPTSGAGELTWPVRGPITSPFCERRAWEACHPGIDIAVPAGTPILAAATGRVTTRGPVSGYGLYTCLQHRPPLQTCYAHQSRLGPTPSGGIVPRGALVGYVGCTGRCFGAHLHFEVRVNDQPVDPLPYLTGAR